MPTNNLNPWGNSPLQAKIPNESTIFPGITKEAENKIFATAQKQGKNQYERNLIANDLYKEALKEQNSINFNNNRSEAKQQLFKKSTETKDKAQSNDLRTTERTAEVADMIRNYSKTNGYGDLDNWEDIDIINGFTNDNKQARNEIQDYINGNESAFSFSNRMGFGAGDNRSRFDMLTSGDGREWNDDILGHFETESYDNADNKVGTWFKNLGKSTYNLASDITNMVVNPVDTLNNLSKAAVGGAMNLVGLDDKLGEEGWLAEANKVADGMGDFLKDRYGGVDQIANTLYQDPAGLISDIAAVVTGGAGLAKGAATGVAKTAALTGAKTTAKNAGKVANVANKVMKAGIKYDPANIIMEGEAKALGGLYKGAKGVGKAVISPIETTKKGIKAAGEGLDNIGEWGAKKITGTTNAQDKLYKAQEPRMNILTRKKDLEKRRANSDRANELIVEYGYKPTDTASRLTAHEATMKKIWNEVEKRVNNDEAVGINQSQLAEKLYDYIKEQKKLGSSLNKADIAALEREMKTLNGKIVDLPTLEKKKQLYNSIINNWGESKVSDVFSNGLKVLTHEIGKIEDSILAEIPGEFQKLKNDFGALKDTYEDVFKADMKNQRKKGLGLVETYSRLEGLGDIASGVLSIFNGGAKDIAKGAGKLVMGKALAKARDVDFLVKEGFEDLYNTRKGLAENQ